MKLTEEAPGPLAFYKGFTMCFLVRSDCSCKLCTR